MEPRLAHGLCRAAAAYPGLCGRYAAPRRTAGVRAPARLSPRKTKKPCAGFFGGVPRLSAQPFSLSGELWCNWTLRRACCASILTACAAKDISWPACAAPGDAPAADLMRPAAERLSPPAPAVRAASSAFAAPRRGLPAANAQLGDALLSAVRSAAAGRDSRAARGRAAGRDEGQNLCAGPRAGHVPFPRLRPAGACAGPRRVRCATPSGEALRRARRTSSGWTHGPYTRGSCWALARPAAGQFKNRSPKGLRRP